MLDLSGTVVIFPMLMSSLFPERFPELEFPNMKAITGTLGVQQLLTSAINLLHHEVYHAVVSSLKLERVFYCTSTIFTPGI